MGKLDGKVALITGGSEGTGLATAQCFIAEGAEHVFITGRQQDKLDEAIKKIGSKNVTAVQSDVSNMADLDKLYEVIKKEKGRLDVLVANAGIALMAPLGEITEEHFDFLIKVNMKELVFTVQKALPLLVDGASITLFANATSVKGVPSLSIYAATKAAVRSFARTWSVDLKERKIRVNALSPGAIETNMLGTAKATDAGGKYSERIKATTPLGRLGAPDEIAKAVVFLASDDGSYVTGSHLFADGGMSQV